MPERTSNDSNNQYSDLLLLEDLESLLEDLEDAGEEGDFQDKELPADLDERIKDVGVTSLSELQARIADLHGRLDDQEGNS